MAIGEGRASERATMRKPGAHCSTWSPWLIHTWCRSPISHRPSNTALSSMMLMKARPNSRLVGRLDPAAELVASPAGRSRCRGSAGRCRTEFAARAGCLPRSPTPGPPDRMMPLGFIRSNASAAALNGAISRIDSGLAHAPGDELGHLAAEVDDENGIAGLYGHIRDGPDESKVG